MPNPINESTPSKESQIELEDSLKGGVTNTPLISEEPAQDVVTIGNGLETEQEEISEEKIKKSIEKIREISRNFTLKDAEEFFQDSPLWKLLRELAEDESRQFPVDQQKEEFLIELRKDKENASKFSVLDSTHSIGKTLTEKYGKKYVEVEANTLWQNTLNFLTTIFKYHNISSQRDSSYAVPLYNSVDAKIDLNNLEKSLTNISMGAYGLSYILTDLCNILAVKDILGVLYIFSEEYNKISLKERSRDNTIYKKYLKDKIITNYTEIVLSECSHKDNLLSDDSGNRTRLFLAYKGINEETEEIEIDKNREEFYSLGLTEIHSIEIYDKKVSDDNIKETKRLLNNQLEPAKEIIESFKNSKINKKQIVYLARYIDSLKGTFFHINKVSDSSNEAQLYNIIKNSDKVKEFLGKRDIQNAYVYMCLAQTLSYQSYIKTEILNDNSQQAILYNTAKDYAVTAIREYIKVGFGKNYTQSLSDKEANPSIIASYPINIALAKIASYYNNILDIKDPLKINKAKEEYKNNYKSLVTKKYFFSKKTVVKDYIFDYPMLLNVITNEQNIEENFTCIFAAAPVVMETLFLNKAKEAMHYFRDWAKGEAEIKLFKLRYAEKYQLLEKNKIDRTEFETFLKDSEKTISEICYAQKKLIDNANSLLQTELSNQKSQQNSAAKPKDELNLGKKAAELGKSLSKSGVVVGSDSDTKAARDALVCQLEDIKNPESKAAFILSLTAQSLKLTEEATGQEKYIKGLEKGVSAFAELANETLKFLKKQSNPDILLPEVSLGVGLVLEKNENGFVIIEEPGSDTPAYKAGLRKGQKITGIEKGNPAVKLEVNADTAFQEIANLVRITEKNNDNPALPVKITVEKAAGQSETYEITSRKIIHFNKDHHSKTYNLNDTAINANINLTKELEPYLNKVLKELEVGKPKIIQSSKDICL